MSKEMSEEERMQMLEQIQAMQQEAQKIEEQIIHLERRRAELEIILSSLDEIKNQESDELLIPIGSGLFVEGKITNKTDALINIGSNIVVKKNFDEAKKIINEQILEINKVKDQLQGELSEFIKSFGDLQAQ